MQEPCRFLIGGTRMEQQNHHSIGSPYCPNSWHVNSRSWAYRLASADWVLIAFTAEPYSNWFRELFIVCIFSRHGFLESFTELHFELSYSF
uniref:Ferlin B-domain domain-containing protein n=1 Tax=Parascaris univalens TaxID=6257 RepID=A0A914ZY16_PARUN